MYLKTPALFRRVCRPVCKDTVFFSKSGLRCVCGVVCVLYADQYLIPWKYGVRLLNIFTFQRFDFGYNFNIKPLLLACYIKYISYLCNEDKGKQ